MSRAIDGFKIRNCQRLCTQRVLSQHRYSSESLSRLGGTLIHPPAALSSPLEALAKVVHHSGKLHRLHPLSIQTPLTGSYSNQISQKLARRSTAGYQLAVTHLQPHGRFWFARLGPPTSDDRASASQPLRPRQQRPDPGLSTAAAIEILIYEIDLVSSNVITPITILPCDKKRRAGHPADHASDTR